MTLHLSYLLLVLVCTATTVLSVVSIYVVTRAGRRRRVCDDEAPAVTVLKPLCGVDDALEANLETFFRLDYPRYELLFGVEGASDPAIAVVRRLRARFPRVDCRLVIHQGRRGLNPKVSNLLAMLEAPTHDVVVISDSNVAVEPGYLRELTGQLLDEGVGLVTSLFRGEGERTLGAALENLHLNGPVAGGLAGSQLVSGQTVSVGKSMMFRRSVLGRLGGLQSVAALLAEDYVIGRMFREAGYEVRLSACPVRNVCVDTTVAGFVRRHLRWGLLRSRLKPLAYPLEILANPAAVALVAPLCGWSWQWPALWAVGLIVLRDLLQWLRLRGAGGLWIAALGPVKEVVMAFVWLAAPFLRRVAWRGRWFLVSAGTRLYAESPIISSAKSAE